MKNILVLIFIALLVGCKKEVSELPEATQTGADTFGARVRGALWIPQGFGIAPTAPILEARLLSVNELVINARNFGSSPSESEMEFYLKEVRGTGTYLVNAVTDNYPAQRANYAYYVERKFTPTNEWITTTQYTGKVEITKLDLVNGIVSGRFEFSAINMYNTPEPLMVSDGRFDIKIE